MGLSFPIPVIGKLTLSTQTCRSAMILRFPKPDSSDELQSPPPLKVVTRSNELTVSLPQPILHGLLKTEL
jgi:hypothetical protein